VVNDFEVVVNDFERAGNDFEVVVNDFERARNDFEVVVNDFERAGNDLEVAGNDLEDPLNHFEEALNHFEGLENDLEQAKNEFNHTQAAGRPHGRLPQGSPKGRDERERTSQHARNFTKGEKSAERGAWRKKFFNHNRAPGRA